MRALRVWWVRRGIIIARAINIAEIRRHRIAEALRSRRARRAIAKRKRKLAKLAPKSVPVPAPQERVGRGLEALIPTMHALCMKGDR